MTIFRKIFKGILFLLAIPVIYVLVSLILTVIPVNNSKTEAENSELIYLSSNGVHLDIVMKKEDIDSELIKGLVIEPSDQYVGFGWGDRDFYLKTPTWSDLTFKTAFNAVFLKGPSLMHVSRYARPREHWVEVKLSRAEQNKLNELIQKSFDTSSSGEKVMIGERGYSLNDEFYKANGSYSCFNTCNSWVNSTFKKSGLRSCLWTPFDFGLINLYK